MNSKPQMVESLKMPENIFISMNLTWKQVKRSLKQLYCVQLNINLKEF